MAWTDTKALVVVGLALVVAGGVAVVTMKKSPPRRPLSPQAEMRLHVWPKERTAEARRIKQRQATDETVGATTIDLRSYVNVALAQDADVKDNNLAELPTGKHIYAGVPFDVAGSIQLMGGGMKFHGKSYPMQVTNIGVGRSCAKLHLLHGTGNLAYTNFGTVVGKMVLHYADASTQELELVAGQQAFDWWCPLFKTGVPEKYLQPAAGTERAWSGGNACIRHWSPDRSLVLYKSTFSNPQPELAVSSADFVSTGTAACPFLVGLTVE